MRDLFLLDPDVVYLNHGSFGACPRPVFDAYQRWQRELERQPVEFLARERRYAHLVEQAKAELASYVGAEPANVVFVPNATAALNAVARSLPLAAGNEVLTTDHEYGAIDVLWSFVAEKQGARHVRQPVTVPPAGPDALVDGLWSAVTPCTRVVCISHITSPTALRLPVEEICRRAREAGIISIVDGAHAPGQVPLDLAALDADVYAGNCHKWLCAPKGAGFLYVRPELQALVEPLVVSWDWGEQTEFAQRHRWPGTHDPAAYLAVPAAISFQREHSWETVVERCHALAEEARLRLAELFALEPLAPDASWFVQMVAAPLPPCNATEVKRRLYDEHRVEVPVYEWSGRPLVRPSFQAYNDEGDLERLLAALAEVVTSQARPTPAGR